MNTIAVVHPEARPRGRLVYVLNRYCRSDASHFAHVIHLLEELAKLDTDVLLLIEKAIDPPPQVFGRVRAIALATRLPILRHLELTWRLRRAIRDGYSRIFVRIAMPATLSAIAARLGTRARVYFWQSGTVHQFDREHHAGLARLRWYFSSVLPFAIVKRCVDRFVTGPEAMVRYYRDQVGVAPEKLALLYNDVAVSRFACARTSEIRTREREARGIPQEAVVILFVHRFSPVRRTLFYIPSLLRDVLPRLTCPVRIVVAGGGPELPAMRTLVQDAQAGTHFLFLGEIPNREIETLYGLADVFMHPTYNEGFPRVILEAMAAGLPIVTTDAGGTAELLGERQREFVVSRDEPGEFARRLAQLVADEKLRETLAAENRSNAERFDTPRVARMYREVLFS